MMKGESTWLRAAPRRGRTRREFLKRSTFAGAALAGGLAISRAAHAGGSNVLKVGLIGCGGRGTGAAGNALNADPNAKLVAMGDAFAHRLDESLRSLQAMYGKRIEVCPERRFVGFDAYQNVIASGVDVVLLATPPHFRPQHLKAAVEAGKHVFCEKPVAVRRSRRTLRTGDQRRSPKEEPEHCLGAAFPVPPRHAGERPPGIRRSNRGGAEPPGDLLARPPLALPSPTAVDGNGIPDAQLVLLHLAFRRSLRGATRPRHRQGPLGDARRTARPAWGLGGRQVRTSPEFGDIYDHHAVVFEYANGATVHSYTRQQAGCYSDYSEIITGSKGRAKFTLYERYQINDLAGKQLWRYKGAPANAWDIEHQCALLGDSLGQGDQ